MPPDQESKERKQTVASPLKKKQKDELSRPQLYNELVATMNSRLSVWPAFSHKFLILKDLYGNKSYLEVLEDDIVRPISDSAIVDAIMTYTRGPVAKKHPEILALNRDDGYKAFGVWHSITKPHTEEILPVCDQSMSGLTYHRLPFDLCDGPTPLFDEMMSRTSNAEALMQWIGSLFVPNSPRQQYVWIYGKGANGKSTLASLLGKCMGPAAKWEQTPEFTDKFWTAGIYNKRLVIFGECTKSAFATNSMFKSLTGGDPVRVEEKMKPSRTEIPICKFLFLSNKLPAISSQHSDLRRAIFCEMQPVGKELDYTDGYEKALWAEAPHILSKCLLAYQACGRVIKPDSSEIEMLASNTEEDLEFIVQGNFSLTKDDHKVQSEREFVHPYAMQEILRLNGLKANYQQKRFLDYLFENYRVKKQRVRIDDKFENRYLGIKEISEFDREKIRETFKNRKLNGFMTNF